MMMMIIIMYKNFDLLYLLQKNCIKLCDPIRKMFVFKAVKVSCEHPVHLV